ncbi:hypothetical protein KP509_01G104500 [Ceratopteris richardii]|uniref:Uncharacterized protein n=1 Tax=Ceratopteris richardii TaxID=49495 RepID=A0A8T2VJW2_CERRI|nr:hypothetical protein KP509_01G104500 [Ceratopteris richardii]
MIHILPLPLCIVPSLAYPASMLFYIIHVLHRLPYIPCYHGLHSLPYLPCKHGLLRSPFELFVFFVAYILPIASYTVVSGVSNLLIIPYSLCSRKELPMNKNTFLPLEGTIPVQVLRHLKL